jgi:predicted metalloprotease with PDZ domain
MTAGRNFKDFFENYVYKATSLDSLLGEVVSLAGVQLVTTPAVNNQERLLGLRTELRNGQTFVTAVYPDSPAAEAGILKEDELISVNGTRIENNVSELVGLISGNLPELIVASGRKIRQLILKTSDKQFYSKYTFEAEENCTHSQLHFRQQWLAK